MTAESEVLPSVADRFAHIVSATSDIQGVLSGISEAELAGDLMRRLALERLFEIISMASDHIPKDIKITQAEVDWQSLTDIGGRLNDTRNRIESDVLWSLAQEKLTALKLCAERRAQS